VQDIKAKLVLIWSQSGETARVFSKHHFPVPIVALSTSEQTQRRMALFHGVLPQKGIPASDMAGLIADADDLVRKEKLAEDGDRVVIVAGWSPAMPNTMNGIIIHTVGEKWVLVRPHGARPASAAKTGTEA
jgi:pyruvate kinase